ncbi:MAG: CbiX/SirB N-terminal domain-containing protein [Planctomycetaceae bacterium]|nr:CbiX/SirB N-terminal domain-containing protein [Planctomycetaceae bacterium]
MHLRFENGDRRAPARISADVENLGPHRQTTSMSTAILLIAHGSRVQAANDDLTRLAELLSARRPDDIVEHAYLELSEPSIPRGLQACIERGATEVRMLPWFLSAGAHVTEDLEAFRRKFESDHAPVRCRVCPPLGLHPLMIEILLDRLNEVG